MNEVERYEKIRKNAYALLKDYKDTSDSHEENPWGFERSEPSVEEELPPEMLE